MKFFVVINDEQQGPFSIDQLAQMGITPVTEVWTEGMDDWLKAAEVPELDILFENSVDVSQSEESFNDNEYYVVINDEQQGPFSIEELAQMGITPETEVWTDGMDDWVKATDVPELRNLFAENENNEEHYFQKTETHNNKKAIETVGNEIMILGYSFKKRNFIITTSIVAALLLLLITNPSQQRHSEAVQQNISEYLNGNIDKATGPAGELGTLIGEAAKAFTGIGGSLASNFVTRSNYLICSVGHIGNEMVSFGILGMVFTFDDWLDQTFGVAKRLGDAAKSLANGIDALDNAAKAIDGIGNNANDIIEDNDHPDVDEPVEPHEVEAYPSIYDQSSYHFTGTIAGSPVVMNLRNNEGQLSGSYYYSKFGPKYTLQLEGDLDFEGNISLTEFNTSKGIESGYLEGYLNEAGDFSGTFTNSKGNSYSFHLHL